MEALYTTGYTIQVRFSSFFFFFYHYIVFCCWFLFFFSGSTDINLPCSATWYSRITYLFNFIDKSPPFIPQLPDVQIIFPLAVSRLFTSLVNLLTRVCMMLSQLTSMLIWIKRFSLWREVRQRKILIISARSPFVCLQLNQNTDCVEDHRL